MSHIYFVVVFVFVENKPHVLLRVLRLFLSLRVCVGVERVWVLRLLVVCVLCVCSRTGVVVFAAVWRPAVRLMRVRARGQTAAAARAAALAAPAMGGDGASDAPTVPLPVAPAEDDGSWDEAAAMVRGWSGECLVGSPLG